MPKKKKGQEEEKPTDLAEELPVWNDDELDGVIASGGAAYSADDPELLLPEPLRERVAEWLKPDEFVTGVEEAPAPAVLHVEPWPAPPPAEPEEGAELGEEAAEEDAAPAEPEPLPAVTESQEYSRDLKCEWDLAGEWSLGLQGLAVPTERAPPPPPEPVEEGEDGEAPLAPPPAEPEDLGTDPTMARIAQAFLAVSGSATPAEPGSCLWEAVYPKDERGWPTVSESGIYAVKLWWDGQWRCVAVDDRVPVDANGVPLLVHSVHAHELWPMLVAKALLRLGGARRASLAAGLDPSTLLHHLSGWSVETRPAGSADIAALLAPASDGAQDAVFVFEAGALSSAANLDALPDHAMLTGPLLGTMPSLKVPPPPEPVEVEPEEGEAAEEEAEDAEEVEPEAEPEPEPLPPTHKQVPLPYSSFASLDGDVIICRPIGAIEHKQPVRKEPGNDAELGQCFCIDVAEPTELLVQLTATAASDPAAAGPVAAALWCKVVVEAYDWSQPTCSRPVLELSTHDFASSTITIPAGRWCYKLAISSVSYSQVDLVAKVPIAYGEEIAVLEEQLEIATTMVEGEPAAAAAGEVPLLFQCTLAVEAESAMCFDLRAADGGIFPPSYFVITSEGEDGRQQQEHFCQRTSVIKFLPGTTYSMMVLFCSAAAEGRQWRMRTLSKGAAPEIAIVAPQFADRIAKPYAPVKYYPPKIMFRTYVECTLGKDVDTAYAMLQLSVPNLTGGNVKLEVFADGVGVDWEADDKCVVSATGRRTCCVPLALVVDKSTKVLLQGSVTDATCIDTEMEWQLDIYATEPDVQLADDTAKADGFRAIMDSWETEGSSRAENAAATRSQYLQAVSGDPADPAAEEGQADDAGEADEKATAAASDPIVKTGATPVMLQQEKLNVLKEERLSFVEQAAANAAAVSKQRESQKVVRASKQQALEEQLSANREQYAQAAGAAWTERDQYRAKRTEQTQKQKEVLAAAAVLQDVIRGAEEIAPESLETLGSVLGSSIPAETLEVLMSVLNKQTPDEAVAETFTASLVEMCGLTTEQVVALLEYPEAEIVPAGAAESLCAVVSHSFSCSLGLLYLASTVSAYTPLTPECWLRACCSAQGKMCIQTPWEIGSPEQSLFPVPDFTPAFEVSKPSRLAVSHAHRLISYIALVALPQAVCAEAVDQAIAAAKAAEEEEAAGGKPAKGKKKK
jgi:hypothetical protein